MSKRIAVIHLDGLHSGTGSKANDPHRLDTRPPLDMPFPDEPRWNSGLSDGIKAAGPERLAEAEREKRITRSDVGAAMADDPLADSFISTKATTPMR
jgi:hypothetical protein